MAKPKLSVCALNVVIHDEEKRNYKQLVRDAGALREVVAFNKTHAASLISTSQISIDGKMLLNGTIYRFINVSPPYFDANRSEVLLDDDGAPINLLPPHVKSSTKEVRFLLQHKEHRIYVDTKNISPKMARNFFEIIFNNKSIVDKYGSIDVSLHSSRKAIESILGMYELRSLVVKISRPNPVGVNRFDEEVYREMEEQGAEKQDLALRTRKNTLRPNDNYKKYMHAAQSHGSVVGQGRKEDGTKDVKSTEDYPMRTTISIGKDEPYLKCLFRAAKTMWEEIKSDGNSDDRTDA
ncbi:MAG: DUF4747 family protein [Thermodesulfobacteriota bacterium]